MEPRCSRAIIECGQKGPIFTPGGQSNAPDNMWQPTAVHTGEISHHALKCNAPCNSIGGEEKNIVQVIFNIGHKLETIEIATAISKTKLGQARKVILKTHQKQWHRILPESMTLMIPKTKTNHHLERFSNIS